MYWSIQLFVRVLSETWNSGSERKTGTQSSHYLKKCICMYLHTGVKRVCTKNVTLTHNYKEKAFSFLHLQVLKKLCTEKRAWWRDSTLETNLQSQYGLNEASANKEKKKIFSKVTLSWRSELQIVFPLKNQPRCILSTVQHQGVFNVLAKRIFKKTARGLIHQK